MTRQVIKNQKDFAKMHIERGNLHPTKGWRFHNSSRKNDIRRDKGLIIQGDFWGRIGIFIA